MNTEINLCPGAGLVGSDGVEVGSLMRLAVLPMPPAGQESRPFGERVRIVECPAMGWFGTGDYGPVDRDRGK